MLKLIKKNTIPLICVLLSMIMAIGGVISYAKFITKEKFGDTTGIGLFSYSASINGISALTFTNTNFWGSVDSSDQGGENMVAMNVIRTVDFEMKNFDGDKVNAVRTGYTMTYTSPVPFASSLALQIVNEDGTVMIPQIVVSDILKGTSFSTSSSKDYNGEKYVGAVYSKNGILIDANPTDGNDLYFVVTQSTVADGTAYTATAKTPDGNFVVTVTPRMISRSQTLNFRLWDVSMLTDPSAPTFNEDGGKLISPLSVLIEESQLYYDISITMPAFEFPAGIPTIRRHTLRLVPTVEIDDPHMGGLILDYDGSAIERIYSEQNLKLQNTLENIKTYSNSAMSGEPISDETVHLFGTVKIYNTGSVSTIKRIVPHSSTRYISDEAFGNSNPDWINVDGTKERREISYIVYEQTKVDSINEVTEVLSTSTDDHPGHQKNANLKVTSSGTSTTQVVPVALCTVVYERLISSGDSVGTEISRTITERTFEPEDNVETTTSVETIETKTVYKSVTRSHITRDITAKEVSYTVIHDDGTLGNKEIYTLSSPFNIFDSVANVNGEYEQKYYVSRCFSKSYPMSVDITFEQRSVKDEIP